MRSRTSFFDKRVSLHLLRRFWPLFLVWLAVLLMAVLGVEPPEYLQKEPINYLSNLRQEILDSAQALVWAAFFAGALMAMAMLSYLYFPRDCGLLNSLPLRREAVYFTAVLTGLVPMLVCDLLAFGLLYGVYGRNIGIGKEYFLWWLEMVVCANVGFYGIACFCGTLTGHVLVLPAVYAVLSCTAAVFEAMVRAVFVQLLYGYQISSPWSEWLSPPVWFTNHNAYTTSGTSDAERDIVASYAPQWIGYLAGVCAVGLVLAALGVLIVRRRHMEAAGEIVAVPVLRPVFRVCMTVGCGLGLPMFLAEASANQRYTAFPVLMLEVLVCAALGYFAAEMLIKKSLRVFDHGWKQLGVLCACLLLFVTLTKLDVLGYETHIPEADEIESVELSDYMGGTLREPETIQAFLDFQRTVVEHREENRAGLSNRGAQTIWLNYALKNGKTYSRCYRLSFDGKPDPDSDLNLWQDVLNLKEVRLSRLWAGINWSEDDVRDAWIEIVTPRDRADGIIYSSDTRRLSPAEAVSLYREAILPDAENNNIGHMYVWDEEHTERTNLTVAIYLRRGEQTQTYDAWFPLSVSVLKQSENTLRWLKENLDLEPEENTDSSNRPAVVLQ